MNRPPPAPFTILVIDDDPGIRKSIERMLATDGYQVLSASGGEDGLSQARREQPDLILVDYYMPEMNGVAVVERLKAHPATRRIPVVALTSAPAEYANELIRAGCIAFIPKPFEPTPFLRLVGQLLIETAGRRRSNDPRPGS